MDLHYEVSGSGQPLLLLHSGAADLRDWTYLRPYLETRYKVIAMDGRGEGKSPAPIDPPNYIEDVRDVLDHAGVDRAFLAGHSMGGQVAVDFALQYPERVSRLVLSRRLSRASGSHRSSSR